MQLFFDDCIKVDNYIYFVARNINLLGKINISNGKTEVIDSIPENSWNSGGISSKIVSIGNKLYLIPFQSNILWSYDLLTKEWEKYPLNINNTKPTAYQAYAYEDKIYMIGCFYPSIIVFDINNKQFRFIDKIYSEIVNHQQVDDCYFRIDSCQINNVIYLASCISNSIVKFSLEDEKYNIYKIGNPEDRFSGITWDGNCFWIASRFGGYVFKWDGKNKADRLLVSEESDRKRMNFAGICNYENIIYVPSRFGNVSIYIDSNTGEIEKKPERFSFVKCFDDKGLLMCYWDGHMLYKDNEHEYTFNGKIDAEQYIDIFRKTNGNKFFDEMVTENEAFDLELFLKII